jgi:hypothetical protein
MATFKPNWVATLLRNHWQLCSETSGNFAPKYAAFSAQLYQVGWIVRTAVAFGLDVMDFNPVCTATLFT